METPSFKEDHISNETLNGITQEFKSFAMSAYQSNEYDFYAEAHIPKIKSLVDKRTGELVERKPHIHIVIPKINLETGKRLTPFEMIEIDSLSNLERFNFFNEHYTRFCGLIL